MKVREEILAFWFGSLSALHDDAIGEEQFELWFQGGQAVDEEIRERFQEYLEAAADGAYDDWAAQPAGRLALIIVLDQFSRNIYRGTPQAFAYDEKALQLSLDGIDIGHDMAIAPTARVFFYMPLEHSEELGHQQRCLDLMKEVRDAGDDDNQELFDGFVDYAQKHLEIIEEFGRFPHRNAILDREPTPEEQAYLADGGATFGQ